MNNEFELISGVKCIPIDNDNIDFVCNWLNLKEKEVWTKRNEEVTGYLCKTKEDADKMKEELRKFFEDCIIEDIDAYWKAIANGQEV